jgi:hypothetical protein
MKKSILLLFFLLPTSILYCEEQETETQCDVIVSELSIDMSYTFTH